MVEHNLAKVGVASSSLVSRSIIAIFYYIKIAKFMAGWQSGYAAACKAVYAGSIPASAFNFYLQIMPESLTIICYCLGGGIW